jgi:hypothetical protein
MNTPPYKQGSLRYHTYASATAGLAKRRVLKLTRMTMADGDGGYFNNLNLPLYLNTSLSSMNMPTTGESIEISSIYLNIDKIKGVYFAKDVKNVIFTLPENLSDLYYYDADTVNDCDNGTIYKISNRTRINLKNLDRFVFQRFNNNIDGILF